MIVVMNNVVEKWKMFRDDVLKCVWLIMVYIVVL